MPREVARANEAETQTQRAEGRRAPGQVANLDPSPSSIRTGAEIRARGKEKERKQNWKLVKLRTRWPNTLARACNWFVPEPDLRLTRCRSDGEYSLRFEDWAGPSERLLPGVTDKQTPRARCPSSVLFLSNGRCLHSYSAYPF